MIEEEVFIRKFANRVIRIRKAKELTQSDLARLMNWKRQNINRLETGTTNPQAFTVYQLAKCLKVSVSELMDV